MSIHCPKHDTGSGPCYCDLLPRTDKVVVRPRQEGKSTNTIAELVRLVNAHNKHLRDIKDAVVKAFGEKPMGCDGAILVRVDQYNDLVEILNKKIE